MTELSIRPSDFTLSDKLAEAKNKVGGKQIIKSIEKGSTIQVEDPKLVAEIIDPTTQTGKQVRKLIRR